MADDAFILEQAIEIPLSEARYPVEIEIKERSAKVLALGKDGAPAQPGLKTLQTEFLEQATIIVDRETPFTVVITKKFRCGATPAAACPSGPMIVAIAQRRPSIKPERIFNSAEKLTAHRPSPVRPRGFPR
jgi:hypothetical protein